MYCKTLLRWKMKPLACSSEQEALMYLDGSYTFDLGIIDLYMLQTNNNVLAIKIKEKGPLFPMILMTSSYIEDHDQINNYIVKPVEESKLLNILINILKKKTQNLNVIESKKQISILLAEDMYINQKVAVGYLKKLGQEDITIVENGQETINAVKNKKYDLLLLDIRMPIMNGETAAKEINELYPHNKPYIVALTANVMTNNKEHYITNCGMNDFLPKPIDMDELKKIINKVIKLSLN
jgi:CheY-like chemotaxis protein